ncbi:DUF1707 domain-containing protein [Micromonospora sp. NBC_01699]|uniref:DUF1707 SHOCT-like domain-containing protein n=1 Tax=Micromonospora sp. NBC_01699 TaxID=2975984 RepID=UPI002E2816D8|nr:DUF1707 domain-containing protein [Micromonospora sp. NBC_01699]
MERRGDMRAADADRQLVAERLRLAVDEGRLDLYEYDERLRAAYAAKTYAELDGLVADLPEPATVRRADLTPAVGTAARDPLVPGPDGRYPDATRRWLLENWTPYFSVVTITVAGWAIISMMAWEVLYFWPIWVAGPWGAMLLVGTVSGLAHGRPQLEAARRARKKAAKRARLEQRTGSAPSTSPEPGAAGLAEPGQREGWQLGGKAD